MSASKPTVGIFGLTGCAGDQLAILNCEDELLELVELLDIRDFLMASSERDPEARLDIALVEGAVVTERDEETLLRIRERSDLLVAIGACAVSGGIVAMERFFDRDGLLSDVYGETSGEYDLVPVRPVSDVVEVDAHLPGCPIEKHEFLSAVANLLNGNPPLLPQYPVCTECKMRENGCLLVDRGEICLGPVTAAGCDARCPSLGIACVGCRGPARDANPGSALALFEEHGISKEEIVRKLGTFAPFPTIERTRAGGTAAPDATTDRREPMAAEEVTR